MSEYTDVIKALAAKLQKDRVNTEWEDGSENLNYIMDVRLQQDIVDCIVASGMAEWREAVDVASTIATRYLDGLIGLVKEANG